jgi:ATP-dependent DNA ligase
MIRRSADGQIVGINRKGLIRALPPAVLADAAKLPFDSFLADGEIIGETVYLFDLLECQPPGGSPSDLRQSPYEVRFLTLLRAMSGVPLIRLTVVPSWFDVTEKRPALEQLKREGAEGAVFKLATAPFRPGRNGSHSKFKFVKSLTAKIVPKSAKDEARGHNSVALALLNERGEWVEVAHASTIGKRFPTSTGSYVEANYLYAYGSRQAPRLVQARLVAARTDVDDTDCSMNQIQFHEGQGE